MTNGCVLFRSFHCSILSTRVVRFFYAVKSERFVVYFFLLSFASVQKPNGFKDPAIRHPSNTSDIRQGSRSRQTAQCLRPLVAGWERSGNLKESWALRAVSRLKGSGHFCRAPAGARRTARGCPRLCGFDVCFLEDRACWPKTCFLTLCPTNKHGA